MDGVQEEVHPDEAFRAWPTLAGPGHNKRDSRDLRQFESCIHTYIQHTIRSDSESVVASPTGEYRKGRPTDLDQDRSRSRSVAEEVIIDYAMPLMPTEYLPT